MTARRPLAAVFVAAMSLVGVLGVSASAQPHARCDIDWKRSTRLRAKMIRCWARDRHVDPAKAVRVAHCESGPTLQDRYTADGYGGPFQQATAYWPARARTWGAAGRPVTSVWANAKVSTAMAKHRGWTNDWPHCGYA